MVTLAQKFAELNEIPPDPPQAQNQAANPPQLDRTAKAGTFPVQATFLTPPGLPIPTMQSPKASGRTSKVTADTPPAAAARSAAAEESDDDFSGLPAPTSYGMHRQFNYTTRVTSTHVLVRLILHNGVEMQDIDVTWVTPRVLKLRVAWPEWFQMAEQMAEFTIDDSGQMLFPPEHALTMDTSERNQQLVEEDGRVWDDGHLTFDFDMKVDDAPVMELLDVQIPSRGKSVCVLQLYVG